MKSKYIGLILIVISVLFSGFTFISHQNEMRLVDLYVEDNDSCYLPDGTCLHQRNQALYISIWALLGASFLFGLYLLFVDKTQDYLLKQNLEITKSLENAKKYEKEKDEFNAYISNFTDDEKKILKAIKEQEGILQSTLRFRVDLSKTALSLILKSLEERKVIKRQIDGKTKKVFFIKKF